MSSIEDIIRRIVREELDAHYSRMTPPQASVDPNFLRPVPHYNPPNNGMVRLDDVLPIKITVHDTVAGPPVYTPPADAADDVIYASKPIVPRYEKRTGCTCPPGAQTSCPDKTCPWKP